MTISSSTVYWYDDGPWGGCRVPASWKLYYKDSEGKWQEVAHPSGYSVKKGNPNTVHFDKVKTAAVKLEVSLQPKVSSGVFEWEVEFYQSG